MAIAIFNAPTTGKATLIKSGKATISTAGGTPNVGSETISFGVTFASPPVVLAVSSTTRPDLRFASAGTPTTTGVPIYVAYTGSTTAASISVSWVAIGTKA